MFRPEDVALVWNQVPTPNARTDAHKYFFLIVVGWLPREQEQNDVRRSRFPAKATPHVRAASQSHVMHQGVWDLGVNDELVPRIH